MAENMLCTLSIIVSFLFHNFRIKFQEYQGSCQILHYICYSQITTEVEKELHHQEREDHLKMERRTRTPEEIRGLTLGQEISRLLDETPDPSSLEVVPL